MNKYEVLIARTETTLYTYEIYADNKDNAEEIGMEMFGDGVEADYEKIVWGEDNVHEVNLLEGTELEED